MQEPYDSPRRWPDNIDDESEATGYDWATGRPVGLASNWLQDPTLEADELGEGGASLEVVLSPEDREDNGQAGPTQENGGLGLGDEEGLGRSALTEPGEIGAVDRDPGGALDRLLQR